MLLFSSLDPVSVRVPYLKKRGRSPPGIAVTRSRCGHLGSENRAVRAAGKGRGRRGQHSGWGGPRSCAPPTWHRRPRSAPRGPATGGRALPTHLAARGAAAAPARSPEKSCRGRRERARRPLGSSPRRRRRVPGARRSREAGSSPPRRRAANRPAGRRPWGAQTRQVQLPRRPAPRRMSCPGAVPRSPASPRSATATSRCPRTRRPPAPPGEPLPPTLAQLLPQQPGSARLRAAHRPLSVSRATAAPARRLAAHPRSERASERGAAGAAATCARCGPRPAPLRLRGGL